MDESIKDEILSWIKLIVIAFVVAFLLKSFVFQIAYVKGPSMQKTLYEGQILIITKLNYIFEDPKRGDIVVLHDELEGKDLIKRVIGMPNEEIEIKNESVYINGEELSPDYSLFPTYDNGFEKSVVPESSYFVLGDNRLESRDSRSSTVGFVDRANIVGRAVFRIWPLNKIGVLK